MSSAQPLPFADLPGAESPASLSASQSAAQIMPAPPTFVTATLPLGAGAAASSQAGPSSSSAVAIPLTTTSISSSTSLVVPIPTSQASIVLPSQAISIAAPVTGGASGAVGDDRVLTAGSITQGVLAETSGAASSEAGPSLQSGISTAQVLTVEVQRSSTATSPALITAAPQTSLALVSSARSPQSSSAVMERLNMNTNTPQTTNIFNPDNRLFPLGITAVSIAGIFLAILSIFLIIRLTGCSRHRRKRYAGSQPLPPFLQDGEDSLSFHTPSVYRDRTADGRGDIEKGALGSVGRDTERYPPFTSPVQDAERGKGWDTSHVPDFSMGIASTRPAEVTHQRSDSGYTAYEQIFFPTNDSPPPLKSTRSYIPYIPPPGTPPVTHANLMAATRVPRDSALVRQGQHERTASGNGSPFLPSPRPNLVLANPDASRQATPQPPTPLPVPAAPSPTHVQYRGFQPRTLRNSTSTLSSFDSSASSLSAYSNITRATQVPTFQFDMPMPAFMGGKSRGGGDGERRWFARDRGSGVESLDVPKDAVSRRGSEDVGH